MTKNKQEIKKEIRVENKKPLETKLVVGLVGLKEFLKLIEILLYPNIVQ